MLGMVAEAVISIAELGPFQAIPFPLFRRLRLDPGRAGPVAVGELAMPSGLGSNVQSSNSAGLQARRPPKLLGRDKNEKSTGLADQLPDWVGYTLLYGISIIPIVIAGTVVAILFFNSLK